MVPTAQPSTGLAAAAGSGLTVPPQANSRDCSATRSSSLTKPPCIMGARLEARPALAMEQLSFMQAEQGSCIEHRRTHPKVVVLYKWGGPAPTRQRS